MSRIITYLQAAALAFGLSAGAASAATVTYEGVDYEVSTVYGSFSSNSELLSSQVWWKDSDTATVFAGALQDSLGISPRFAFTISPNGTVFSRFWFRDSGDNLELTDEDLVINWAVASPVSAVPLPAGLPLLLTGFAAFAGLRLRKRRAAQV